MDDEERRRRQFAFEEAAALYDRARPGYPEALFDELIAHAGLRPGARVLEIGAGTGIATTPLLARGLAITAVEPGPAMRAVAETRLGSAVRFLGARFEDVPATGNFAAVVAAQAFHWVEPAVRLGHTAAMLQSGGTFAYVENVHDRGCPFRATSEPVYRRLFGPARPSRTRARPLVDELRDDARFDDVVERRHPWVATYTTAQVVDLVSTFSDTIRLPDASRQHLLDGLAEAVERLGGTTPYHRTARLVMAAKQPPSAGC